MSIKRSFTFEGKVPNVTRNVGSRNFIRRVTWDREMEESASHHFASGAKLHLYESLFMAPGKPSSWFPGERLFHGEPPHH